MHIIGAIWLVFVLVLCGSWVGNLYKLTQCDFKADYKCEVLHGAGLIPIVSLVTVWADTDK